MSEKKTILIADDEVAMLKALVDKFKKSGFEVIQAGDGEEAYEKALAQKPDLVMLDILMPKFDGITIMKKIRLDQEWGARVPIIILTNLSDHESMMDAAENCAFFLVKIDWNLDDIVKLANNKLAGL
jgi:DNA-binding response OmpR family regulator